MSRIKTGSINQVFQWTLENVDETFESRKSFFSPDFYVYDNNGRQVKLTIQLNPIIKNPIGGKLSTIHIFSDQEFNITWRLSIKINGKNIQLKSTFNPLLFSFKKISDDQKQPDGKLTIKLTIIDPAPPNAELNLADSYENLLHSMDFSDITIETKTGSIKCHRAILASRSTVFKAMLQDYTKEGKTGIITLKDVDHEVIQDVIKFIYCGKLNNLSENAVELFKVAHMYQIDSLADICINHMEEHMTTMNVLDIMTIAETYNLEVLKFRTMEFILANVKSVMATDKWAQIPSEMEVKILRKIVSKHVK